MIIKYIRQIKKEFKYYFVPGFDVWYKVPSGYHEICVNGVIIWIEDFPEYLKFDCDGVFSDE